MGEFERRAALAEALHSVPGVECSHVPTREPSCERDAGAIAPLVEQWIAESNTAAAADVLAGDETALGAAAGFHYHSGRRDGAAAVVARVEAVLTHDSGCAHAQGYDVSCDCYLADVRDALASVVGEGSTADRFRAARRGLLADLDECPRSDAFASDAEEPTP